MVWIVTKILLMRAKISRHWVAGCALRVAGYGLRVTGCALRVTGGGLRVTGLSIGDFRFRISDWKELMG